MKKIFLFLILVLSPLAARADFWGGDLPLLAEIVTNTLRTMQELQIQNQQLSDELDGIKDRIERIRTIAEVVQPSTWEKWRDPMEALKRLRIIYQTMPKEYRSEKSDLIDDEISKAMNLVAKVSRDTASTFASGKELERRGADSSPGVAEKLTASGIGTLIAMESQSQVIQSHVTSLLAQMLADANEREARTVITGGSSMREFSDHLSGHQNSFSGIVLGRNSP